VANGRIVGHAGRGWDRWVAARRAAGVVCLGQTNYHRWHEDPGYGRIVGHAGRGWDRWDRGVAVRLSPRVVWYVDLHSLR
jgi:hypothetical protein